MAIQLLHRCSFFKLPTTTPLPVPHVRLEFSHRGPEHAPDPHHLLLLHHVLPFAGVPPDLGRPVPSVIPDRPILARQLRESLTGNPPPATDHVRRQRREQRHRRRVCSSVVIYMVGLQPGGGMGESLFSPLVQSPVLWLCSRAAPTYEYYTHALTYTNGERAQNTEYREIGVAAAPDRGAAITPGVVLCRVSLFAFIDNRQ